MDVMGKQHPGIIVADSIDVRFAFSGTVGWVGKKTGDSVKKFEIIANLNKKVLQMELDRQLADYEKTRGVFEIFKIKNPDDRDDITKYTRQEVQATLNISIKDVEIAKHKLDQANLYSPVDGVIVDLGGLVSGLNITPASNSVSIIDLSSLRFEFSVKQESIDYFFEPRPAKIHLAGVKKEVDGATLKPTMGKNGVFTIRVTLEHSDGILPGMTGLVHII